MSTRELLLERRIVVGLIISTDYLRRVAPFWSSDLIESPEFRRVAGWCLSHFERYHRAPDQDIEQVYLAAIREEGIPRAEAELIEGMLTSVSEDYGRDEQFNSQYLFDLTTQYFRERELEQHNERVRDLVERGQLDEATALASSFVPRSWVTSRGLDVGTEQGYDRIRSALEKVSSPIVSYPGALGDLLNEHLVRDGFVVFVGPEKRGKTFWLTDVACRALRQKCNVAFFQAGDMTEAQYLRRLAVYLARRSDLARYCRAHWRPVGDCVHNQFDRCDRPDRNCDHGAYETSEYEGFASDPSEFQRMPKLAEVAAAHPDYRPCSSATCDRRWPCVWLSWVPEVEPLSGAEAARLARKFFERYRRRLRLGSYSSGTLTCDEISSCLAEWEAQDGFVPDVVAVDYADIMAGDDREFRHRQNAIWMGLRRISQDRHALVVSASQADAASYRANRLGMGNFSEDKRKWGHVTAGFGLNQDPQGREKGLGVMRLNTIVAREGEFSPSEEVHVLQDLAAGRPFTGSFRVGRTPSLRSPEE